MGRERERERDVGVHTQHPEDTLKTLYVSKRVESNYSILQKQINHESF